MCEYENVIRGYLVKESAKCVKAMQSSCGFPVNCGGYKCEDTAKGMVNQLKQEPLVKDLGEHLTIEVAYDTTRLRTPHYVKISETRLEK